jgi:hypothetical protein
MENEASPSGAYHFLLFLLLSAFLVLAAAHLLESVCYSVGLVDAKPVTRQEVRDPEVTSLPLFFYRILAAVACLFLAYHCMGLKDWARKGLVWALLVDLIFWMGWSVKQYLLEPPLSVGPERVTVQVLAVALEGGLVWILTHPEAIRHFAPVPNKGSGLPI